MIRKTTNKGFSLLEVTLVLALMSISMTALMPNFVKGIQVKAAEKTALDMYTIQEAARAYFIDKKIWPTSVADLQTNNYLPAGWVAKNPFKNNYEILSGGGGSLIVSSKVQNGAENTVASRLPVPVITDNITDKTVQSTISSPAGANTLPIGVLLPWSSTTIPSDWLLCDGHPELKTDYPDLYTAIGDTFTSAPGGTTFQVPDLRGRTVVGLNTQVGGVYSPDVAGAWNKAIGYSNHYGEENHTLTIAEMPSHTHGYMETPWMGSRYDGHSSPLMTSQRYNQTDPAGGNQAHNNIQPSMTMAYIIKAK